MEHKKTTSDSLKKRINDFKKKDTKTAHSAKELFGPSANIAIEFVAGVVTGGIIGYALDSWFGTLPLCFMICMILGMVASIVTIYKTNTHDSGK